MLTAASAVAAVAAVFGLSYLDGVEDEAREDNVTMLELQTAVERLNGLEWQAVAGEMLDPALRNAASESMNVIETLHRPIDAKLHRMDPQLHGLLERYLYGTAAEFEALAAGDREKAEQLDETVVDPTFTELRRRLKTDADRFLKNARATNRLIGILSSLVVLIAMAFIAGLYWLYQRLSRREALAAERQLATERVAEDRHKESREDELTGLANRRSFVESLDRALAGVPVFTIVFLDLDGFKEINDTLGHAAGDESLRIVATRLKGATPDAIAVARLGGDEFAVLLPTADRAVARRHCHAVHEALTREFMMNDRHVNLGVSIGYLATSEPHPDRSVLMRRADTAMYSAKAAGSRIQEYHPELDRIWIEPGESADRAGNVVVERRVLRRS